MGLRTKHLILFFFSLVLLFATLFVPRKSDNKEQIKNLELGYPMAFITQDLSFKGASYFPTWQKFEPFDKNCPIKNFFWPRLSISLLAVFLSLEIIIFVLESLDFRIRRIFARKDG